jgi:hypothetical protein
VRPRGAAKARVLELFRQPPRRHRALAFLDHRQRIHSARSHPRVLTRSATPGVPEGARYSFSPSRLCPLETEQKAGVRNGKPGFLLRNQCCRRGCISRRNPPSLQLTCDRNLSRIARLLQLPHARADALADGHCHRQPRPPFARFPRDKDGSARRNIEPLQGRRGLHFASELRMRVLDAKVRTYSSRASASPMTGRSTTYAPPLRPPVSSPTASGRAGGSGSHDGRAAIMAFSCGGRAWKQRGAPAGLVSFPFPNGPPFP